MGHQQIPPPHPRREPRVTVPLTADGIAQVFEGCADFGRRTLYLGDDPQRAVEMLYIVGQVRNERASDYVLRPLTQCKDLAEVATLDEAYVWDGSHEFSREHSLAVYYRQPDVSPMEPADTYLAAARENLAVVAGWAQAHPDTQFHIWSAPYSILYWDNVQRLGRTDAYLAVLELAWRELTQYDNITVHSFLARADIVADLDNYTDYIHCSGAVTYLEAQTMMAGGEVVDRDNYLQKLDELREFVVNYDYDALFA